MPRRVCQHLVSQARHLCVIVVHGFVGYRRYHVSDVMCSLCCVSQQTAVPDTEPLGTCVRVCARVCFGVVVYVCVCVEGADGVISLSLAETERDTDAVSL